MSPTTNHTSPEEQRSLDQKLATALTYLPTIVVRNIEQRTLAGKTPIRLLGEFGQQRVGRW